MSSNQNTNGNPQGGSNGPSIISIEVDIGDLMAINGVLHRVVPISPPRFEAVTGAFAAQQALGPFSAPDPAPIRRAPRQRTIDGAVTALDAAQHNYELAVLKWQRAMAETAEATARVKAAQDHESHAKAKENQAQRLLHKIDGDRDRAQRHLRQQMTGNAYSNDPSKPWG